MIDRPALEAALSGAEPSELFAVAGELQARGLVALAQPRQTPPPGRRVSVREAAEALGCSQEWLYHNKGLPFVLRLGRRVVIDLAAADAWMQAGHGSNP